MCVSVAFVHVCVRICTTIQVCVCVCVRLFVCTYVMFPACVTN